MKEIGRLYFFFIIMFVLGARHVYAQYSPNKLSETARLSIITVGPADQLYTLFGHTAIRLQDPKNQVDIVYNYGTFDFNSDNFYWRFIRGDLRYYLSKSSFKSFKQKNSELNRTIREQILNTDSGKIRQLVRQLEINMLPENRYYRYEFFTNNCVTKVRDVLEQQTFFKETYLTDYGEQEVTYRQLLYPYLNTKHWIRFGINLILGSTADEIISKRSRLFLPNQLFQFLPNAELPKADGSLILQSNTLVKHEYPSEKHWFTPVLFFWFLFVLVSSATMYDWIKNSRIVWIDRLLFGGAGILGVVLIIVSFGSQHEPLPQNWNLIWALPAHVITAIGIGRWNHRLLFRFYLGIVLFLHSGLLLGWTFIPQQIPIAVIPIVLMFCFRIINLLSIKRNNLQLKPNHHERIHGL